MPRLNARPHRRVGKSLPAHGANAQDEKQRATHGVSNPVTAWFSPRTNPLIRSLPVSMKTILSDRKVGLAWPTMSVLTACGGLALLAGCASEPASVVVSAPPPPPPSAAPAPVVYSTPVHTTVQTVQPGTTVATVPSPTGSSSIVVMQAPPSAQQEVPAARPTRDHVWIPGYWSWQSNQYQWMAGRWVVPPRSGAVWVPPRWQPEGSSWRFYEGYWD
jgi:hypothetical protein